MRTVFKWAGLVVGTLLVLAVIAGFMASRVGEGKINAVHDVDVAALDIPTDSASVANGAHLAAIHGCTDCHGEDLAGRVMAEDGPFRIVAGNLTPGGVGGQYGPEDWNRAIRHGVAVDGTVMFVMPSGAYHSVSDAETADLIAFLDTLEPVRNDLPPMEYRFMGKMLAAGPLNLEGGVYREPTRATSPEPGATVEYGEYFVGTSCAYCHGEDLSGKQPPADGSPYAPSLVGAGQWTPEAFHRALTTGVTPSGRELDSQFMPWPAMAKMTHDEREGLRLYLATLADQRATEA